MEKVKQDKIQGAEKALRLYKSRMVAITGAALALLLHIFFLVVFYLHRVPVLHAFNYISIILYSVILIFLVWKRAVRACMMAGALEVIVHQVLALLVLGWGYGFEYYFFAVPGFILLNDFIDKKIPVFFTLLSFTAMVYFYWFTHYQQTVSWHVPPNVKSLLYFVNLFSIFVFITAFEAVFVSVTRKYESSLLTAQDQLYLAATTDSLTTLCNRNKVVDFLEEEDFRVKRSGKVYTIAIGDIDDFKTINDTYGHGAGDAVLVAAAEAMKRTMREQDVIGRWGGEEFIIVFPETGNAAACRALKRLNQRIADLCVRLDGVDLRVSMTFGVADSRQAKGAGEILRLADNALYIGKHRGKNCVIMADEKG